MATLNLYNKLILLLLAILLGTNAFALEVVYPKNTNLKINAASTFFIGNAKGDKSFQINDMDVKLREDGAFVQVMPLNVGENKFVLKSKAASGEEKILEYTITRPDASNCQNASCACDLTEFNGEYIYSVIVKNNVPLRLSDSENAKRVTHLDKGTALLIDAQKGDYYRVFINHNVKYWVKKDYVTEIARINEPVWANLSEISHYEAKNSDFYEFKLNFASAYSVAEKPEGLELKLFQLANPPQIIPVGFLPPVFQENILTLNLPKKPLWGYDCYHNGNNVVLKVTKQPQIDPAKPLKGLSIAVDAGHGGCDGGAIGPTRVREADLVLDISQKLAKLLKDEGANVVQTRECDKYVDLYERIELAKKIDPIFLISIHANALPDGLDPYSKYGTSVFYYNNQAKSLADAVKKQIVQTLAMKDDGTNYASFVLTRPTFAQSILIEVGYMINPDDYKKLLDENFRTQIAQNIVEGLKKYLLNSCGACISEKSQK